MASASTNKPKTRKPRCANCQQNLPSYEVVNSVSRKGGTRRLCQRCSNAEVAAFHRVKFEEADFEPFEVRDADGAIHTFHFSTIFFGPGISLHAFELRDGERCGYQYSVIDKPAAKLQKMHSKLVDKIRRQLSVKHLKPDEHGQIGIASHKTVRARIDWDEAARGTPMLVIDGKDIAWEHFGQMLMSYEGWHFKLEIHDQSEEL